MLDERTNLMTIDYADTISERNNRLLESSIAYELDGIDLENFKGVLLSLKKLKDYDDYKLLSELVTFCKKLSIKYKVSISFIDYNVVFYSELKKVTLNTDIKLFKNLNVANLLLGCKKYKEDISVLIYDEDIENSKQLKKELSKYGYTIILSQSNAEFQQQMHDTKYEIIITHSALNMDIKGKKSSSVKTQLTLSKKLILNLPVFMDTAVETLVSFTGLDAKKSSHTIKSFDTGLNKKNICAVMRFSGDIDGFFTLIFPIDIAVITMETLLGEVVDEKNIEELRDGVAEFCNIITGSTKTVFASKGISVVFELPKTYTSLQTTMSSIGTNNGVWIDMLLADKPFYLFITK